MNATPTLVSRVKYDPCMNGSHVFLLNLLHDNIKNSSVRLLCSVCASVNNGKASPCL